MTLFVHRTTAFCLGLLASLGLAPGIQTRPVRPSAFEIRGTLVDGSSGEPLAGAEVTIALADQDRVYRSTVSRENGGFVFENLPSGMYKLTARSEGYLTQSLDQHGQHSTLVAVEPGLRTENVLFKLPRQGSIVGRITNEWSEAVRDATVMLFQTTAATGVITTRLHTQTATDDQGFYRFDHLFPGKYYVAVSAQPWYAQHPGFPTEASILASKGAIMAQTQSGASRALGTNPSLDVSYPITLYPGGSDPAKALPILLGPGASETADMSLYPVPALHSHIKPANPQLALQSQIILQQSIFDSLIPVPILARKADADMLEIAGFPAGRYTMRIDSRTQAGISSETQEVDFSRAGELSERDRRPLAVVTAILQNATPGAQGVLRLRDRKTGRVVQQPISGEREVQFQQGVQPGEYDVSFSGFLQLKNISSVGGESVGKTLRIQRNQPVRLTVSFAEAAGRVTGVALQGANPVAGAMIVLVPEPETTYGEGFRKEQSNTDGSFSFLNIPYGSYKLFAIENGWELEAKPGALKPHMEQGTLVQVPQDSQLGTITVSVR